MKKWFKFFDNSVGKNLLIPLVSSIVSLTVLLAMLSPADALTNDMLSELTEVETSQVEEPNEEVPEVEEPEVEEPSVEEPEVEEPSVEEPEVEEPSVEVPEVEEPSVEVPEVEEPSVEVPGVEEPSVEVPGVEEPNEEVPEVEEPEVEEPSVEVPEVEEPSVEVPEVEEPSVEVPGVEEPSVEVPEVEEPSVEVPEVEEPGEETPEVEEPSVEEPEVEEPSVETPDVEKPTEEQIVDESETITTDTFESLGGEYTFKYIFNNYNVFSFGDIEGTHIVGPIIAKNQAYRTSGYQQGLTTEQLIASDLANGISSYVGVVKPIRNQSKATVAFNYGHDPEFGNGNNFPNFYTNDSLNTVVKESGGYMFYDGKLRFTSPNNWGNSPTFQNDNFICFETAKQLLLSESYKIANKSTNYVVKPNYDTGVLEIEAGKNYLIEDASRLREVNIIYPDGYHPITNPYPYNTIINIIDDALMVSGTEFTTNGAEKIPHIDGSSFQYFPKVKVNGEGFNGAQTSGKTADYGENNSIIWNMPNIKTEGNYNRLTFQQETDILGHIFAPSVEVWNLSQSNSTVSWNGGNINGGAVVAAWHGGVMENHMWPYAEGNTDEVMFKFSAEKEIIGNLGDKQFQFELGLFDDNSKVEGLEQNVFPQVVTVVGDGKIDFLPVRITKPGTYTFRIKENIPEVPEDNVIYDRSEYKLTLDVEVTPSGDDLSITSKITKVKDEFGNPLSPEVNVDKAVFENKEGDAITPATLNLNGRKTLIDGTLTEGQFKFSLELLTANPQDGISSENTSQTVANASDGSIVFAPITYTKAGTYEFIVKEIMPDPVDENIVYDKREYKWTVNVTLDSEDNKKLITTSTLVDNETNNVQSNEATFVNRVNVNPVDLSVIGIKQLIDGTLTEGQFAFKLELESANPVDGVLPKNLPQTVSNLSDGTISFLPLTFTKEGTYVFSIKEEIPKHLDDTIIYDESEYQLTVTVRKEMVEEKAVLVTDSKLVKLKDSTGTQLTSEVIVDDILFVNKLDYDFKLPETGGEGRLGYMGIGLSLMGLALYLVSKKLNQSTKL